MIIYGRKIIKYSGTGRVLDCAAETSTCVCCGGTGTYDEGFGPEECSCCAGTGKA